MGGFRDFEKGPEWSGLKKKMVLGNLLLIVAQTVHEINNIFRQKNRGLLDMPLQATIKNHSGRMCACSVF